MQYMWFTGINYYKLAVEKDRDSIFTTIHMVETDLLRNIVESFVLYMQLCFMF